MGKRLRSKNKNRNRDQIRAVKEGTLPTTHKGDDRKSRKHRLRAAAPSA